MKPKYFEVRMQEFGSRRPYVTYVWAYTEFGIRECMSATEPQDKILSFREVECSCDDEGLCGFHSGIPLLHSAVR